jgi:hypothetical protein
MVFSATVKGRPNSQHPTGCRTGAGRARAGWQPRFSTWDYRARRAGAACAPAGGVEPPYREDGGPHTRLTGEIEYTSL